MKSLHFKKLTLQNFLSIGDTEFILPFEDGLNIITGYNRDTPDEKNGIGKSTICDGLMFALFNETVKSLKMSEIVNDKNKKHCKVKLEFYIINGNNRVDYIIERGLKPSICSFGIAGGVDMTRSSIPKTNSAIIDTIGISKDLFKQSIIMSIGNSVSFFKQGKVEKRKFIEGIFNLEVFSDMLTDCRANYNESKRNKERLAIEVQNEETRLKQYIEKDATFEDNKKEFIEILRTQIASDMAKIKDLSKSVKVEDSEEDLNSELAIINDKLEKIEKLNLVVEVKLNEINSAIVTSNKFISESSVVCPTCNREYDNASDIESLKASRISELEKLSEQRIDFANKKTKITSNRKLLGIKRDAIKVKITSIKSIKDSNKSIKSHISTLKSSCVSNLERIRSKELEESDFAELISKTQKLLIELNSNYDEAYKDYKIYDICKFVLSEEGVKSVIINRLKNLLNSKMNFYLKDLGSQMLCTFDEYFSESIYNKNGVEKSYDSFSGGESKRIDLALLLTFQDILKTQCGIDIRLGFYDEILDTSLDASGRDNVIRILKGKSEKSATYIISHRSKMSDIIDREIVLEKHNDFTFLKEII